MQLEVLICGPEKNKLSSAQKYSIEHDARKLASEHMTEGTYKKIYVKTKQSGTYQVYFGTSRSMLEKIGSFTLISEKEINRSFEKQSINSAPETLEEMEELFRKLIDYQSDNVVESEVVESPIEQESTYKKEKVIKKPKKKSGFGSHCESCGHKRIFLSGSQESGGGLFCPNCDMSPARDRLGLGESFK